VVVASVVVVICVVGSSVVVAIEVVVSSVVDVTTINGAQTNIVIIFPEICINVVMYGIVKTKHYHRV